IAGFDAETFIPWQAPSIVDYMGSLPVYDTLAYPSTEGFMQGIPSVATQWEFSEDFLTFTLSLREGIPWQGGWGEVTAEDVKYTFERMMGEDSMSNRISTWEATIESVEAKDPYTVVFHQKIPSTVMHKDLIAENHYMQIVCKKYVETVGTDEANYRPVGSAAYRVVEHKYGNYIKYEAVEDHWRAVPEFKYIIITTVPEESTRVAMLKTGQIDATHNISPLSLDELPEDEITVHLAPGGRGPWLTFGGIVLPEDYRYVEGYHNQDPWVDIRVREAMNIAIDRKAINKALHLDTATERAIAPFIPGDDEQELIPYDPERAKQLLADAGYPDGFSFDLIVPTFIPDCPLTPKEVEAVGGYFEEIGLTANINIVEFGSWYPGAKKMETAGEIWPMAFLPSPDYTSYIDRWKPNNSYTFFQDTELTRLGLEIEPVLDIEKKNALWREFARYHRDNWLTIPLLSPTRMYASSKQTVGEWPLTYSSYNLVLEYARHPQPLNTWRLFTP
ncbi:ABC transporter substrate-binding protein, partial [Chloroflexota bacterium]